MINNLDISSLNFEKFEEETDRRKFPLIINFDKKDTPETSLDTLVKMDPDMPVTVRIYGVDRKTTPRDQWTSYCEYTKMSLADYAKKIVDSTAMRQAIYLALFEIGGTKAADKLRPRLDEISKVTGLEKQPSNDVNLWIAPGGHLEPLHFDGDDGTIIQFSGSKTITLFEPKLSKYLYPFPWWRRGMPATFSRLDLDNVDQGKYPKASLALSGSMKVHLKPGQALFIPAFWWHQVLSEPDTDAVISVNRFWKTQQRKLWRERPGVALATALVKLLMRF